MAASVSHCFGLVPAALLVLAACGSDSPEPAVPPAPDVPPAPSSSRLDPAVVETWIQPERFKGFWTIYADVRDFVGEERWARLDTAWMPESAKRTLAGVTALGEFGLHR